MKTFAIDSYNDIIVQNNSMLLHTDILAVQDVCLGVMQGNKGEMIFNQNAGIPYFDLVFTDQPNIAIFSNAAKNALLSVENVIDVPSFTATQTGNTLNYAATIQTSYGTGTINGGV